MSSYLSKTIAAAVAVMAMGLSADGMANNSSTNEVNLATITIEYDRADEVADFAFNWDYTDYNTWDVGMDEQPTDGGGGGGGEYTPVPTPCEQLSNRKPENCPNPIPFPSGYNYGSGQYANGTGIPKLLYFIHNMPTFSPAGRQTLINALSYHTQLLTDNMVSRDRANESLLLAVTEACKQEREYNLSVGLYWPTYEDTKCLDVLEVLRGEASHDGFTTYFSWWLDREGIDLTDLDVPKTFVNWMSPENSLRKKHEIIEVEVKCSTWWQDVQANQCGL